MGLQQLKGPAGAPDAGIFNLPPGFDSQKHAAEWVEEGKVPFKQQRQSIPGANVSADGWSVYKGEKNKLVTTTNGAGKRFVLMVRPKQLQNDVNALCGNIGKEYLKREIRGETVAGAPLQDPGMLPESRLKEAQMEPTPNNDDIPLNKLSGFDEPSAEIST